jgi:sec-independent protein translocase protein TatB
VFDIGTGEVIALAVVALLVLGPEKLPQYAAEAARTIRQLRRMANDARSEVTRELGPELDGLDLRDLNPRSLVRKHLLDPLDDDDDDDDDRATPPPRGQSAPRHRSGSSSADAPYDPDTT